MLSVFYSKLASGSQTSIVIISISLILISGFAATRLTKPLHLPNVTAYIVAGIILGPYCLNLIPSEIIDSMDFIADIALAFIAFSTGEFFRFSTLKRNGKKVVVIALAEALFASLLVFISCFYLLKLDLNFSIVLAALASATAPASAVVTIRQTGAKGEFVDTLLQDIALDDMIGLIAYSVSISLALAAMTGDFQVSNIIKPVVYNVATFILGGFFGFWLKKLLEKRSTDNRLIVSIAMLFSFCGICALLDVSPLLGCMSMGMIYINCSDDERLFKQLNYFSPPILLLFFVRSGLNFDLDALVSSEEMMDGVPLLVIGIVYFIVRIIGKYAGSFVGCQLVGKDKLIRNYLGLALIPQAGVAIGLAAMGARTLSGQAGKSLETVIVASSVLYELIGPACGKLALYLSKSYSNKLEDLVPLEEGSVDNPKSEVDKLIERIQKIQQELPKHYNPYEEDEKAYSEAAEQQAIYEGRLSNKMIKRRQYYR